MLENLLQDLRIALRRLGDRPLFFLASAGILAMGIGASTAVFSIVDGVLLKPFPFPQPDRLAVLWETYERDGLELRDVSFPAFLDWRENLASFQEVAAFSNVSLTLGGGESEPEQVQASLVSSRYFELMGARAALGSTFPSDAVFDRSPRRIAVLSAQLWNTRFGRDPDIIGKGIRVQGVEFRVIGVMPEDFVGLGRAVGQSRSEPQLWAPISLIGAPDVLPRMAASRLMERRRSRFVNAVGRLSPGFSIDSAREELRSLMDRRRQLYPDVYLERSATVRPMRSQIVGDLGSALWSLMGVVLFLLVVACSNVAGLLLARSLHRRREMALRLVLGARGWRLFRLLMAECLLLALAGGAVGIFLAIWSIDALFALSPVELPGFVDVGVNARVLSFALGLSLLTALLFGAYPAMSLSRTRFGEAVRSGGRGAAGGFRHPGLDRLMMAQMAVAFLLLVVAGLTFKSFRNLVHTDPGFQPRQLSMARLRLPAETSPESIHQLSESLRSRLEALPEVESAALASDFPLAGGYDATIVQRAPGSERDLRARVYRHSVSPGFFRTLGIDLLQGRDFDLSDQMGSDPVVIISRRLAERLWPQGGGLGESIRDRSQEPFPRVVGIVDETRFRTLRPDPENVPEDPDLYYPVAQRARHNIGVAAKGELSAGGLAAQLRILLSELEPRAPVFRAETMEARLDRQRAESRFAAFAFGCFGIAGLALTALGIYSTISFLVSLREQEFGVRMAVGANPLSILALVSRFGLTRLAIGLPAGAAGSVVAVRFISDLLYEVQPFDAVVWLGLPLTLAFVALSACLLPALRASRLDPARALREQ